MEPQGYVVIGLLVLACLVIYAFYDQMKMRQENMRKELEKLKFRNTDLETKQLKFALQPHTLNNILGNIKAMSNQISRSMDSLSSIMEYIFYHGDEHYASVEDEVDFIRSYLRLQDAFSKEINNTQLDLSLLDENNPNYSKKALPHLVTAYLIENAYKHGDVNHPDFLNIKLKLEEDFFEIEVRNKVRKNYVNHKTGIGLSNMKSRLKHLKDGKHTFVSDQIEDDYMVKLKIKLS